VTILSKNTHPYIPNLLPETMQEMMRELGIKNTDELYADIPTKYKVKKTLNLPQKPMSEFEVKKHVEHLLSKNKTCNDMPIFLGAGCWPHYVPAVVKEIVRRSELLTSYTPYQPEISQGMLQALFEYQSMICELTGMEVANCSMYDWASALGEAARMTARLTRKKEILVPEIIHPERLVTLRVYAESAGITVKKITYGKKSGQISLENLQEEISDKTAAVYVENPSYFGLIEEDAEAVGKEAHDRGALFVVGVDPTSLGILKAPGDYGADIVIGEAQPLGNPMNFGGPLLGIMACHDDLNVMRQMPGRIIGMTTTVDGCRDGYCMTLQTREQHIRREKATSNICTNEALCAVASAVYLALLGPKGMQELGELIMCNSNYTMQRLSKLHGVTSPIFDAAHFKEFTVNFDNVGLTVQEVNRKLLEHHVHGGKDLSKEFPELGQTALYCVTEIHSKNDIDLLLNTLREILEAN
jgi:glycine dehydrogenase subunit 1